MVTRVNEIMDKVTEHLTAFLLISMADRRCWSTAFTTLLTECMKCSAIDCLQGLFDCWHSGPAVAEVDSLLLVLPTSSTDNREGRRVASVEVAMPGYL